MAFNEKIFREYDIRGIADTDLNENTVTALGDALGIYLREHQVRTLAIGRDCRMSSPRLFQTLSTRLLGAGIDIVDIGLVPTPLLYFATFHLKVDGGIMITGSHNPSDQNGFKISVGKNTIYGEEIQKIKNLALHGKRIEATGGKISTHDIKEEYIAYVKKYP